MVRYLDIFSFAGVTGVFANVRAQFSVTFGDPSTTRLPALVGYCTVQESITFNSDFRIAKSSDADDFRQQRLSCYGQEPGPCGTVLASGATQIGDVSLRNIHTMFIADPDFVKCDLVAAPADLAKLQMRLRAPVTRSRPQVRADRTLQCCSIYCGRHWSDWVLRVYRQSQRGQRRLYGTLDDRRGSAVRRYDAPH